MISMHVFFVNLTKLFTKLLLRHLSNTSIYAFSKFLIFKVLYTLDDIWIVSTGTLPHFPTLGLLQWCYGNGAAALNPHRVVLDVDLGCRGHPVLNEPNELGGVEVVCANESVSVGCEVGGAGTAEWCFEEVGSGKMTLTATLNGFNQSLLYVVLVQFKVIASLYSNEQRYMKCYSTCADCQKSALAYTFIPHSAVISVHQSQLEHIS